MMPLLHRLPDVADVVFHKLHETLFSRRCYKGDAILSPLYYAYRLACGF